LGKLVLIGAGGFIGSVFRYILSGWVQVLTHSIKFPFGTLSVNVAGCFIIGFLSHLVEYRGILSSPARAFVFVGVLGGFTTFSTFGNESMALFREGESTLAFLNIGSHVVLGLVAVWLGRTAAYLLWR
jgi:fluoride exporter